MSRPKISYAQNGEDVRVWRAFGGDSAPAGLIYADIGANDPWELSITASLHELGWRGVLVEADPDLAQKLRQSRPGDSVQEVAAAAEEGHITFYRVHKTGLGTLSSHEAASAKERGFFVEEVTVAALPLDAILTSEPHFMSIDVEGAEHQVLAGLSLRKFRPWVLCIEAVEPGTQTPNHEDWEPHLLSNNYSFTLFDGVNRWYVANERDPDGTLRENLCAPFNVLDRGLHGWQSISEVRAAQEKERIAKTHAWERELKKNSAIANVPVREYEKQIHELRSALDSVETSRFFQLSARFSSVGKKFVGKSRQLVKKMPSPIAQMLTQRRHVKHATINMKHLTPPEFLEVPPKIQYVPQFTQSDVNVAEAYLQESLRDSDSDLETRMDGYGDLLGRTRAATRTRIELFMAPHTKVTGNAILFDARSLQVNHFRNRGIGRFATAAFEAANDYAAESGVELVLLVDHGLPLLPQEISQDQELIQRVTPKSATRFGTLIQPSPFTHSPRPLIALLASDAAKLAIVFDFIPLHFPSIYLPNQAEKVEYEANIDALSRYTEFISISHLTKRELDQVLGKNSEAIVAWPADLLTIGKSAKFGIRSGPIVVMTGDDPRKNTFGALAAIGAATTDLEKREVVVVGLAGQQDRVHHWSIAAIMRPGEVTTLDRISVTEMSELLSISQLVVIDSFDEGLSLPVLEALQANAKIVASDIPAHRELLGRGSYFIDPRKPKSASQVIKRTLSKRKHNLQIKYEYENLEQSVQEFLTRSYRESEFVTQPAVTAGSADSRLKVAFATPWPPQKSGVADYSAATAAELGKLVDLTIFSTGPDHRNVDELLANPDSQEFDQIISVVGNSHFHLPFVELTTVHDCIVISHDARMNEFYLSLLGDGGTTQIMEANGIPLTLDLHDQIADMRLLQDAAFWQVAHRAKTLVFHTPTSAHHIGAQTQTQPESILFANYRTPNESLVTREMRSKARCELGFSPDVLHLATFGYADNRTKMTDIVLESAAWLQTWGQDVALHVVGSASEAAKVELENRAQEAGLASFEVTGYVNDSVYRNYLLAADLAIQLRISGYLGVSGPLSDLAAYGSRAIASDGLAQDVDTPDFIERISDHVSPFLIAQRISEMLTCKSDPDKIERQRANYLKEKAPTSYADQLRLILKEMS